MSGEKHPLHLAWFSPWPPDPSGVAGRSAELVPALARRGHAIDVFVDEARVPVSRAPDDPPAAGTFRVQSAHDFVWRTFRRPFDLVIYQIGNSRLHEFIWPYAFRWPGLSVLHDAHLHHARGRARLSRNDEAAYRTEFAWSHPDVSPDAAELAIAGFDGAYYYLWPMLGPVVETSRLVAAHSPGVAAAVARQWPVVPVEYVALGEGRAAPVTGGERAAARAALGLEPDQIVFGMFGALSAEKRIAEVLRAFRRTHAHLPNAQLLLAGAPDSIPAGVRVEIDRGANGVHFLGRLDDDAFDRAIAAVDVSLNLRWPSARETSGPWLRALAAGRATIVTDLEQLVDLPTVDPRHWRPNSAGDGDPVAVAIDILDEDHSLTLAMRRLAGDRDLRAALGRAGRGYWERTHTVAHMLDDYERVIARAADTPAPPERRPDALIPDPARDIGRLLGTFGEMPCTLF